MYNELKWLVRRCYRQRVIGSQTNYLKLIVKQSEKKILLVFHMKPPSEYRSGLRLYNFRWSRKYHHWHAYLNTNKLQQVKKIYRLINKNNNIK